MPHIIGITGIAGAGKDTLARAMQNWFAYYGEQASIAGFADPIRDVCKATGLLDPFNRGAKEAQVTIERETFCDSLQYAIDSVLKEEMRPNLRSALYELMVQHTEQFTSVPVGSGFTQYMNISPRQFMQVLGTEAGQSLYREVWVDILLKRVEKREGVVLVPDYRFMHETLAIRRVVLLQRPGLDVNSDHVSEKLAVELMVNKQATHIQGRPVDRASNSWDEAYLQGPVAQGVTFFIMKDLVWKR